MFWWLGGFVDIERRRRVLGVETIRNLRTRTGPSVVFLNQGLGTTPAPPRMIPRRRQPSAPELQTATAFGWVVKILLNANTAKGPCTS